MTDITTAENRIALLQKYLKILEEYQKHSKEDLLNNTTLKGAVERYLHLACQAAIDLADVIISLKTLRKPATMRESFEILAEEKIIDQDLKIKMSNLVGFRNILVHEYDELNYTIVEDVLHVKLEDIKEFISAIQKSL